MKKAMMSSRCAFEGVARAVVFACAAWAFTLAARADSLAVTSANSPYVIDEDATYEAVTVSGDGVLVVTNRATLNAGVLYVGEGGKGTMTVTDSSMVNVTSNGAEKEAAPFKVANGVGSEGHLNLLDGAKLTAKYGLISKSDRAKSYVTISNAQLVVNYSIFNTRNMDKDGRRTNSVFRLQQGGSLTFGSFIRNSPGTTTLFQFEGGVCTNRSQYFASLDGGWLIFEGVNGHPIDYAVLGGPTDVKGYYVLSCDDSQFDTPHVHLTGNGGVRLYSDTSRPAATKNGSVPVLTAVTSDYTGDLVISSKQLIQTAPNQLFSAKNRIVLNGSSSSTAILNLNGFDAECAGIVESNCCYVLNPSGCSAATLTVGADNADSALKTLLCKAPVTVRKVGTGRLDLYSDNGGGNAPSLTVEKGTADLYGRDACGYRMYKWVVTDTYGKNTNQVYMCLSEVEMSDAAGETVRYDRLTGGNRYQKLTDGDLTTTEFYDKRSFSDGNPYFSLTFSVPVQMSSYRLGTGYDYGTETKWKGVEDQHGGSDMIPPAYDVTMCRDPSDWIVYGSVDGSNWVEIDRVAGYKAPNERLTWGPSFTAAYSAPLTSGKIKVRRGATLNVRSARRLVTSGLESEGTINYVDGVTVELKDGADYLDVSGLGEGPLAVLEKSGAGDSNVYSPRTVTNAVRVATNRLTIGECVGVTNRYWRLRLKNARDWWYDPAKWKPYNVFPGSTNAPDSMVTRELALWDKDEQLVTSGAKVTEKPTTMKQDSANKLIDGDTSFENRCWMHYTNVVGTVENDYVLRPEIGKPETWLTYVIQLSDTANPVCTYDFFTHSDHSDRDPGAWDLSVSDDGANWTVIEERNEAGSTEFVYRLQGTANPCGRATYGTYNGGEPMLLTKGFAMVSSETAGYASTATVELGAGAELAVVGNVSVTGSIAVDAAQSSDGTLAYLKPAASGSIEVTNLEIQPGTQVLPFAFTTGANLENLGNWTVTVNGRVRSWLLGTFGNRLALIKPGMLLLMR